MTALPKHEDNIVQFNKGKKMADKFEKGYVMSSRLYRQEVRPFLSDRAFGNTTNTVNTSSTNKESPVAVTTELDIHNLEGNEQ